MQADQVEPVYSVIDPNARRDTVEALKNLAVEKPLERIRADRPQ